MEEKERPANKPLKPKRKFKLNDKVLVVGGYHKIGYVGKIVAILEFDNYRVQFSDGSMYRKMESWLKKSANTK